MPLRAMEHLLPYRNQVAAGYIYDIIEMIKLGEGWMVEFKEKPPKPASLASTLVAFANHQGGTILLGVNDKGHIAGFKATKEDRDNINGA